MAKRVAQVVKNRVKALYQEGHTQTVIGKKTGLTANQVAGLVHRGGYKNRGGESHTLLLKLSRVRKGTADLKYKHAAFVYEPIVQQPTTVAEPVNSGLSLIDLASTQCQWLDGDLKACGHKVHRKGYCKHHSERVFKRG